MLPIIALWLLLAAPAQAQNPNEVSFTVDKWGGLDLFNDSSRIGDFDAQEAKNFLTDHGYLETRPGNTRLIQILNGYAVKFSQEWVAPSNTRYLITHSSLTIYQSNLSGVAVVLSTATSGQDIDMATGLGLAIFSDGSAPPWSWNGTSTGSVANMPICKYLEFDNERFVCANIPSESASRVRVSSYGFSNWWTVPSNVNSVAEVPNSFDFDKDDGESINCLKKTKYGLFIGKGRSTKILKGFDNLTYRKDTIDAKVGCVDDRTVQEVDGLVVWLARDGIYGWPGSGPAQLLSRDIESLIKSIRQLNSVASTWLVDTQGDWGAGTSASNGPSSVWSTTILPGTLLSSSFSVVEISSTDFSSGTLDANLSGSLSTGSVAYITIATASYRVLNGGFESNSFIHWSTDCSAGAQCDVNTAYALVGTYGAAVTVNCSGVGSASVKLLDGNGNTLITHGSSGQTGGTMDLTAYSSQTLKIQFSAGSGANSAVVTSTTFTAISSVSWMATSGGDCPAGSGFGFAKLDEVRINRYFPPDNSSGTFKRISPIYDTFFSTPLGGPFQMSTMSGTSSTLPAGTTVLFAVRSAAAVGGPFSAFVKQENGNRVLEQGRFFQFVSSYTTSIGTAAPRTQDFQTVFKSTGDYKSEVHFIGDITSWRSIDFTNLGEDSVLRFYVKSASYSFPSGEATIPWISQTNHLTVTASTNTYLQFRIDSSSASSSSHTIAVSRVATNWRQGIDQLMASGAIDHRYFLCAAISSNSLVNDRCLIWQKNKKWVEWVGPSVGSMGYFDNNLVVGDGGTDSYVWKIMQQDVYNDDGEVISSTWTGKDFMFAPNGLDWATGEKIINEVWIDAGFSTATILNVDYAVNKSTSYSAGILNLGAWGNMVNKRVPYSDSFALGKYFRPRLSVYQLDKGIRVNGYTIYGEPKMRQD